MNTSLKSQQKHLKQVGPSYTQNRKFFTNIVEK